jgi:pimeloyl-ACP methyl ester carboxylesterase
MKRRSILAIALVVSACSTHRNERVRPTPSQSASAPTEADPVQEIVPPSREVRFQTNDRVTIVGTLQPGTRPDAPLVILVHQIAGSRADFEPLLARLHTSPSLATLAIDLRGHGASTEGPDGTLSFRDFNYDMWATTSEDVIAARQFVNSSESGIQPSRVAIVGASIGSTAAIAAAAMMENIEALVALSPGRAYQGFDAITPVAQLGGRPFLAVAAQNEADSVETAQAMARITSSEALIAENIGHGTAMLGQSAEVLTQVERFLRSSLGVAQPRTESPIP